MSLIWIAAAAAQSDQAQTGSAARLRSTQNYLELIELPPAQQDTLTKEVVDKLAVSSLPTAKDATRVALGALIGGPGLSAQHGFAVTGLYRLGINIPALGNALDPIWEVRVVVGPGMIVRVLWVSATTKAVMELVPTPIPQTNLVR
jgi:hypothetical protein